MFCENCGAKLPENENKCPVCGAVTNPEPTQAAAPQPAPAQTAPAAAEKPQIAPAQAAPQAELAQEFESAVGGKDEPHGFSGKRNIIIIAVAAAVLLAGGIGTAIGINAFNNSAENILSVAQRYLDEKNYEQAILEFKRVLELDPTNIEAYLGLADAYIAIGDTDNAIDILKKGVEVTGDGRIKRKLDELLKSLEPVQTTATTEQTTDMEITVVTAEPIEEVTVEPDEEPEEETIETREVLYEEFPRLSGEVTLQSIVPFAVNEIVTSYYDDVLLIKRTEDGNDYYGLAKPDGTFITETNYIEGVWNFRVDKPFIALKKRVNIEGAPEIGDDYYTELWDIFGADGELMYSDADFSCGGVALRHKPSATDYTFYDIESLELLFTFDEVEWSNSHDGVDVLGKIGFLGEYFTFCAMNHGFAYEEYYLIGREKVIDVRQKLTEIEPQEFSLRSAEAWDNSDSVLVLNYTVREAPTISVAKTVLFDPETEQFIDFAYPEDRVVQINSYEGGGNYIIEWVDVEQNIIAYKRNTFNESTGENESCYVFADFSGQIIMEGAVNYTFGADDYYLLMFYDDKAVYYNTQTGETHEYDDATLFAGDYAFVINDGMGCFINRDFEPVSSETPATISAIVGWHSKIIYLEGQDKVYTYGS